MGTINCILHGDSPDTTFEGRLVCKVCLEEYETNLTDLEDLGKDTLLQIHEAVGRGLKARLKDPEAFARLKVATKYGLDIAATYHKIVTDVCLKLNMN